MFKVIDPDDGDRPDILLMNPPRFEKIAFAADIRVSHPISTPSNNIALAQAKRFGQSLQYVRVLVHGRPKTNFMLTMTVTVKTAIGMHAYISHILCSFTHIILLFCSENDKMDDNPLVLWMTQRSLLRNTLSGT